MPSSGTQQRDPLNAMTERAAKILVIDDDPFIADMYALKLKEAGFAIEQARDGVQGLEKIKAGGWAAVLLDIVLPLQDGFEILQTIQREKIAHPPIVLLTNLGEKQDVDRGLALGAADYIIKAHYTPSQVVEKVQAILGAGAPRAKA